jgi:hypothetical protein
MALFLQMVGAVFVGLIIVLFVVYLWLRWKLRSLTGDWASKLEEFTRMMNPAAAALAYVPPMTLDLSPADDDDIVHPQELELATLEVQNLGFQRGQLFSMGEIGGVCRALFHPSQKLDAVVCDHPLLNVWVEFSAQYADGTAFDVSNAQQQSQLDRPPGRDLRGYPGEQIAVLWERFRNERPSKPLADLSAEGFQQRFEVAYRQEMAWRIDRGGITEEEVRRCVETGGGEFSEEHCQMVQRAWRMRIAQHIDERLREAFLGDASMSLAEYESTRDRLLFVHDRTAPEQLLMYCREQDDDADNKSDDSFDHEERMRQRCQTASPRVVFRELLDADELRGHFRRIREMTEPYGADVYVGSRDV